MTEATASGPILSIQGASQVFGLRRGLSLRPLRVHAVDRVSLDVTRGDAVGIVGESGCGKSTLANMVMRVLSPTEGRILFRDTDLAGLRGASARAIYRHLQMVYQDPYTSLNPMLGAGANIGEPLRLHGIGSRDERRHQVLETMAEVGLRPDQYDRWPSQFSGGQRQRIAIARALVLRPDVVVLDEPVSSLDVSIQAQVVNLLRRLQSDHGLTYLFVSHDLAVVRHLCNRVAVMYLGRIVEVGPRAAIFGAPRHPYTRALLDAVPDPDPARRRPPGKGVLQGEVPSPVNPPGGCRFHPRCPRADARCSAEAPSLDADPAWDGRAVACHHPLDVPRGTAQQESGR